MDGPKIIIFGGYGTFGSRIAADLLEHTDCQVIIAGRDRAKANNLCTRLGPRAIPAVCDLANLDEVKQLVANARVMVVAAGPFQHLPLTALDAALACRVHYLDLADARDYLAQVRRRQDEIRDAGIAALTGLSTVSGISAVLAAWGSQELGGAERVHVALSPGNRNPRGTGTIASVLSSVGRPIKVWHNRQWKFVTGWTGRERLDFPSPVGRRLVYWIDGPDYDILPSELDCWEVIFKAGLELDILNGGLALLANLRQRWPKFSLEQYAAFLVQLSSLIGGLGTPHGALRVQVQRQERCWTGWVVARQDGPIVAATPAAVAAAALVRGEMQGRGLISLSQWISPPSLVAELEKRGMSVTHVVSTCQTPGSR